MVTINTNRPDQDAYSRHRFSRQLTNGAGQTFLEERSPYRFRDRPDNISHVVIGGERLWHIAQLHYFEVSDNAGLLYWVVADYQVPPILDPTRELQKGRILVVPSPLVVLTEILSIPQEIFL